MNEKDDTAVLALLDFLDAVEAGCAAAKARVKSIKLPESWDPSKIQWVAAEGERGPYEKALAQDSSDFHALLAAVQNHGGRLTRDDYFYWSFSSGNSIGRKRKPR